MNHNRVTGEFIYDQLKNLYKELDELGDACDAVSDEVGQQSVAYKILNESYDKKAQEINTLKRQVFTIV